jgi:hypothetical protein
MVTQSNGVPETWLLKWPLTGRLVYEDRGARTSIMARANAHGPDTLQQTACNQLASIHLQAGGGPYIW